MQYLCSFKKEALSGDRPASSSQFALRVFRVELLGSGVHLLDLHIPFFQPLESPLKSWSNETKTKTGDLARGEIKPRETRCRRLGFDALTATSCSSEEQMERGRMQSSGHWVEL